MCTGGPVTCALVDCAGAPPPCGGLWRHSPERVCPLQPPGTCVGRPHGGGHPPMPPPGNQIVPPPPG
eukprot:5046251-Pyramimonas_sp.AAC.1